MHTLHASERDFGKYVVDELIHAFRHRKPTVLSPRLR